MAQSNEMMNSKFKKNIGGCCGELSQIKIEQEEEEESNDHYMSCMYRCDSVDELYPSVRSRHDYENGVNKSNKDDNNEYDLMKQSQEALDLANQCRNLSFHQTNTATTDDNGDGDGNAMKVGSPKQQSIGGGPKFCQSRTKGLNSNSKDKRVDTCIVCGDIASGYHYNALSCEGCKGFFRRSIMRNANYMCNYSGNCEMDTWMRRKCQACRLRRCHEVGMRAEFLLSVEQCRARRSRRKKAGNNDKANSTMSESESNLEELSMDSKSITSSYSEKKSDWQKQLTSEQCSLINHLVTLQNKYELPDENMLNGILDTNELIHRGLNLRDIMFYKMNSYMVLMTKLIIEFAKRLPGFGSIGQEVQVQIIKNSSSEITILRASRRYKSDTKTIVFPSGEEISFEQMSSIVEDKTPYKALFQFCENISMLDLDNAEYALLVSMCLLMERTELNKSLQGKREEMLQTITDTLIAYTRAKTGSGVRFGRLVAQLTDLVEVGEKHSKMLDDMRGTANLHPLLLEFFDSQSRISVSTQKSPTMSNENSSLCSEAFKTNDQL